MLPKPKPKPKPKSIIIIIIEALSFNIYLFVNYDTIVKKKLANIKELNYIFIYTIIIFVIH